MSVHINFATRVVEVSAILYDMDGDDSVCYARCSIHEAARRELPSPFSEKILGFVKELYLKPGEYLNDTTVREYLETHIFPHLRSITTLRGYYSGIEKFINLQAIKVLELEKASSFHRALLGCSHLTSFECAETPQELPKLLLAAKDTLSALQLGQVNYKVTNELACAIRVMPKLRRMVLYWSEALNYDYSCLLQVRELRIYNFNRSGIVSLQQLTFSSVRLRRLYVMWTSHVEPEPLFFNTEYLVNVTIGDTKHCNGENRRKNALGDAQYLICLALARYKHLGVWKDLLGKIGELLCFMRIDEEEKPTKKIKQK